MRKGSICFFIQ